MSEYTAKCKIVANPVIRHMGLKEPIQCMVAFQILRAGAVVREYVEPHVSDASDAWIRGVCLSNIRMLEQIETRLHAPVPASLEFQLNPDQQALAQFLTTHGAQFEEIEWVDVVLSEPVPEPQEEQVLQNEISRKVRLHRQFQSAIALGLMPEDHPEAVSVKGELLALMDDPEKRRHVLGNLG